MKVKLSAVIITYNESENIERCISSLKEVADEIPSLIDSFSSDKTVEIAKSNGAIVFQNKFKGVFQSKKIWIYKCSSDYILSLDADECLSKNLKESIFHLKITFSDAYEMNRKNNYLGQWINHCGWYPDKKIRLFDKNKASWNDNYVHEKVVLIQTEQPLDFSRRYSTL